ncbi:hypothetical protein RHSIM_Rhsim08G0108300 [Rhododendron simsii]|uniref:PRONE domain-containing protein n=1 Tax=Rhododendron simsii TaxID=118357 RepID=A0A834GN18_RHOSS|nr:hypothetical protein RHSIM_Rhsim08G0108300 [Rhododendron simsii]
MVAACASVQPGDLVEDTQKQLNHNRKWVTQILKAAMSINNITLTEMEVPESYLEALPKNGRACLGDVIYRYITSDHVLLFSVCVCVPLMVPIPLSTRYNVHGKIHHYPTLVGGWLRIDMIEKLEKMANLSIPKGLSSDEANKYLVDACMKFDVRCRPPLTTAHLLDKGLRGFVAMEDLSEIHEK